MEFLNFILPALFIGFSAWLAVRLVKRGVNKKRAVVMQMVCAACIMIFSVFVSASEVSAANSAVTSSSSQAVSSDQSVASSKATSYGIGLVAAALVTGLSGIGGGIAVASAAPAAIAATSEDSKAFGKALIFVALGEGIALYGLLVSIMILGRLDVLLK